MVLHSWNCLSLIQMIPQMIIRGIWLNHHANLKVSTCTWWMCPENDVWFGIYSVDPWRSGLFYNLEKPGGALWSDLPSLTCWTRSRSKAFWDSPSLELRLGSLVTELNCSPNFFITRSTKRLTLAFLVCRSERILPTWLISVNGLMTNPESWVIWDWVTIKWLAIINTYLVSIPSWFAKICSRSTAQN